MKARVAASAPIFLVIGTGAIAADLLPLQRGIYVEAGTRCKGASNADTLSYWGNRNGINDQQTGCEITNLKRHGSTYLLKRKCSSGRFGSPFLDEVKLTVRSRTSFVFHPSAVHRLPSRSFRYCGPKIQISPIRL